MLDSIFFTWLGTEGELPSAGWDSPEEHAASMLLACALATKHARKFVRLQVDARGLAQIEEYDLPRQLRALSVDVWEIEVPPCSLWAVRKMHAVATAFSSTEKGACVAHLDLDFFLHSTFRLPYGVWGEPTLVVQCLEDVWDHYEQVHARLGADHQLRPFCAGFLGTNHPRDVATNIRSMIQHAKIVLPLVERHEPELLERMNYYVEQGSVALYGPHLQVATLGPKNTMTHGDWTHLIRRHRGSSLLREILLEQVARSPAPQLQRELATCPAYVEAMFPPAAVEHLLAQTTALIIDVGSDGLRVGDVHLHPCEVRRNRYRPHRNGRASEAVGMASSMFGDACSREGWQVPWDSLQTPDGKVSRPRPEEVIFVVESPSWTWPGRQLRQMLLNVLAAATQKDAPRCYLMLADDPNGELFGTEESFDCADVYQPRRLDQLGWAETELGHTMFAQYVQSWDCEGVRVSKWLLSVAR
jgi:hypothetical protein